jgi:F0F1-type ATP synthase delta subunit
MSALTVDARAGFRGASRNALAELRQALTARAESSGSAGADTVALGEELFAVASLLDAQPALRRALTDRSRTPEERSEFVQSLLGGQVSEAAAELTGAAVTSTWSRVRDLADALEYAGVLAVVIGAERSSRLDELEDELFRFSRIVEGDSGLLRVLNRPGTPGRAGGRSARGQGDRRHRTLGTTRGDSAARPHLRRGAGLVHLDRGRAQEPAGRRRAQRGAAVRPAAVPVGCRSDQAVRP